MKESENILRILEGTKKAIQSGDGIEIKSLSDQTTNTAALTQDPDNIAVAVMVYSIGKILGRENYKNLKGWDSFYKLMITGITKAIEAVRENNMVNFRKDFSMIRKAINKISGGLRKDIEEVFRKAQINKASRIYAHGISMEQTAKILGVTMYELAEYAGKSGISDVQGVKTMNTKDRIKLAMEMFG